MLKIIFNIKLSLKIILARLAQKNYMISEAAINKLSLNKTKIHIHHLENTNNKDY